MASWSSDEFASAFDETSSPSQLTPSEATALAYLREKLEDAILDNHIGSRSQRRRICRLNSTGTACSFDLSADDSRVVELWGVPLLPSNGDPGTDVILLKFLRARDFRVLDALHMIKKTLRWRQVVGADKILKEDLGMLELDSVVYMDGFDRNGRPVCYNMYGAFKNKELYHELMGNGSELVGEKLLKWRIWVMEKSIQKLSFNQQGGVGSILQIIDLKDAPGSGTKRLQAATRKVLNTMQDNYPEFVTRNIFVNVPFRCYAQHVMFSRFLTPRTKSKFIFARPNKVTETLLKFIAPEELPVKYGGFKRGDDDNEFTDEEVKTVRVRPGGTEAIVIPVDEPGMTVVWDTTVVGWEANYKEEFIPNDECLYKVLIQKEKKMEESVRNSFYINEPGKIVLTVENKTFKKKKVLYRFKTKPTFPIYDSLKSM